MYIYIYIYIYIRIYIYIYYKGGFWMEQNLKVPRDRQRHLPDTSFKYSSSGKLGTVLVVN